MCSKRSCALQSPLCCVTHPWDRVRKWADERKMRLERENRAQSEGKWARARGHEVNDFTSAMCQNPTIPCCCRMGPCFKTLPRPHSVRQSPSPVSAKNNDLPLRSNFYYGVLQLCLSGKCVLFKRSTQEYCLFSVSGFRESGFMNGCLCL